MSRPVASVTGANGGIGVRLCRALAATHDVRGLFRAESARSRAFAAAGGTVVLGDLDDAAALERLVTGADLVVHAAAKMTGLAWADFQRINVEGTRRLARAAAVQRCRRFVHVSSIAVYGADAPGADGFAEAGVLPDDPALDAYSRSKRLAERAVAEELGAGPTEFTIVRPTCVYGPGIASWTLVPLDLLRKKRPILFGLDGGEGRMDAVYVDDVVAGIVAAAQSAAAAGQIFNLGGEDVSFREFYAALAAMVGHAPALGTAAGTARFERIARRLARVIKPADELARGLALARRMSANRAAYPGAKARRVFGYEPRTSLTAGMLETELWLRGAAPGEAPPETAHALPRQGPPRWNCDRHYALRPMAVARPADEAELADIVRRARRAGLRVKAIGRLHTFAPVPDTPGVAVSLERLARVVRVDGRRVSVQSGITLAALSAELARHGLALPVLGSYAEQSLAGAVATATHGGSLRYGTLADTVTRVRWIGADGAAAELTRGEADFDGAVVSLGLLGLLTELTLECVPAFRLRAEPAALRFGDFLRDFAAVQASADYVDARWYPQTGDVEVLRMHRTDETAPAAPVPAVPRPATPGQRRAVSLVFKTLLRGVAASGSARLNAALVRKLLGTAYRARTGRSDEVLAFTDLSQGEPFPIDDLELAVPLAAAPAALAALDAHFRGGGRMPVFFPVHLRCSRAGGQWLAANDGQDVCWFEFWHYPAAPALYAELAAVLAPFAPRWHLGKILAAEGPAALNLPRREAFLRLRQRLDPDGVFMNGYAARVLGIGK